MKANSSPACLHYSPAEWHGLASLSWTWACITPTCPTTTGRHPRGTECLKLLLWTETPSAPRTTRHPTSGPLLTSTEVSGCPSCFLRNYLIFPGYEDDIYLLVKLGEAAIIIFIIFALVAIIYMIVNCCVSFSGRNKWNLFYFYLFCLRSFLVCYIWSINPLFFLLVFDISGSCNFPN